MTAPTVAQWRELYAEVVDPGLCMGCAACVIACPRGVLAYAGERPVQTDAESGADGCRFGDAGCTVCAKACARLRPQTVMLESAVMGRAHRDDEPAGVARSVVAARGASPAVHAAGQDGGFVTALLGWALEHELIDGAVVSGVDPTAPLLPVPVLATTPSALLAAARSRYTYSANPLLLRDVPPARRVALVGTPCQVSAVRRAQASGLKRFRSVVFTVGLMCSEAFTVEGFLHGVLESRLGIDLRDVAKVNIKGRVLVSVPPGREGRLRQGAIPGSAARIAAPGLVEVPLKECKPFAREACHHCPDFAAELADVSAGGLGLDGWTIAMARTGIGEDWLHGAAFEGAVELRDAGDFPEALAVRDRLAAAQRRRPAKHAALPA
ncbi:MAG TPA: Coenzyme F420 hydrogenase/dehydrogenase, beta subunit C-terminal domain [Candidatus Dormibacteraeota bacterium]|nr:Coenzyme F420 hydrogenase/dehydrogenase, beta subunit C-terminal domain [Candidatus Dormibacteraeota bacterium]